jgi:hypothetical protein
MDRQKAQVFRCYKPFVVGCEQVEDEPRVCKYFGMVNIKNNGGARLK